MKFVRWSNHDDVLNDISSREWVEHGSLTQSSSSELPNQSPNEYFFTKLPVKKTYQIDRALSSINVFTSSKGMQNNNDLR